MNVELILWLAYEVLQPISFAFISVFVAFCLLMMLIIIAVKTLLP